ncbi:hypothetical protein [Clostridium uliginosum]|uniref:Uncharacterized protein n=1 Tax=Clostridium uliginosum TaxID=119641 RepID=A0A1I1NFE1_9CLOT|nr:hypothetical protein [Clostridium uliginosum]SFC94188.1 hypothetical protein SAMN05421842_11449 [Clostridium uliginosum]
MFYKFPSDFLVPVLCVDDFKNDVDKPNDVRNRKCVITEERDMLLSPLEEGVEYITMKNLWNELDEEYANNETER